MLPVSETEHAFSSEDGKLYAPDEAIAKEFMSIIEEKSSKDGSYLGSLLSRFAGVGLSSDYAAGHLRRGRQIVLPNTEASEYVEESVDNWPNEDLEQVVEDYLEELEQ